MTAQTLAPGTRVFKLTEPDRVGAIVGAPRVLGELTFYPVMFDPPTIEQVVVANLAVYEGEEDIESLLRQGIFAGHDALSRLITYKKLSTPLSDTLYAFMASRTDLYSYQYKPLLKFLESDNQRLLLADEVGLGKTIEAGLILVEQRIRSPLRTVLIACPASLRTKWKEEMARRFDEHFEIVDKARLQKLLRELVEGQTPADFRVISSFGTLRTTDIIEQVEGMWPPLDLVIVDEAHHLRNPETRINRAVTALMQAADGALLLTATPIHLGNENLFALLRLLDPQEYDRYDVFERRMQGNEHIVRAERLLMSGASLGEVHQALRRVEATPEGRRFLSNPTYNNILSQPIGSTLSTALRVELQAQLTSLNLLSRILSRSRKVEVQPNRPVRSAQVKRVDFSPLEMQVYQAATGQVQDVWSSRGANSADTFRAMMSQRQIASSLPAALQYFQSRDSSARIPDEEASDLSPEELDQIPGDATPVPHPLQHFFSQIDRLEQVDSKYRELLGALRELDSTEPNRKVIIFSYFRATLAYLARRLHADGYRCLYLTGEVPSKPGDPDADERGKVIRQFRSDALARILLSSEVGSEGLDFEFCHILINYDLPWNPMVVEQRIGRVDRMGQKSDRIVIINLSVAETIEDRILKRLYLRIGIFEESIGDLEAILGDIVAKLRLELLGTKLSPTEQEERIAKGAEAIEREKFQAVELERKSATLLGHDDFFELQLDRKRKMRQYVSARELAVFVSQFLKQHHPRAALEYDHEHGMGRLAVTPQLIQFVRRHTPQSDPLVHTFLRKTFQDECVVTFEAERAAHDADIEFITANHPLVRSIVAHYATHERELRPTALIRLCTHLVSPGEYCFAVELVRVTGVRPRTYLDPTFVRCDDASVLDEDAAKELLGTMVEEGGDFVARETLIVSTERMEELRGLILQQVGKRIATRRAELAKLNDQLAGARLESIKASYEAKRNAKQTLLDNARARNRAPQYVRMLEGSLRNLEATNANLVQQVDESRKIDLSFGSVAAGVLIVDSA